MSTAEDPRSRTKIFLDAYLTAANLTKDNGVLLARFITQYRDPPYPMRLVFFNPKHVDIVYSIDKPTTIAETDFDGSIYKYRETVPIRISTVTKPGVTGDTVMWKAERELRRIVENNPAGSYRSIRRVRDGDEDMEGWVMHHADFELTYERDIT